MGNWKSSVVLREAEDKKTKEMKTRKANEENPEEGGATAGTAWEDFHCILAHALWALRCT